MKNKLGLIGKSALIVSAVVAAVVGVTTANAAIVPPGRCICTDNYAPVICSNGVVYSNACRASCARATGCVPYGSI